MSNVNALMERVREGMDVYGSDREKIGEVGDVNIGTNPNALVTSESTTEERSYFQVTRGVLGLGSDRWVPGEDVVRVDEDGVTLQYPSDEVDQHGWGEEPSTPDPSSGQGYSFFDLGLRDNR